MKKYIILKINSNPITVLSVQQDDVPNDKFSDRFILLGTRIFILYRFLRIHHRSPDFRPRRLWCFFRWMTHRLSTKSNPEISNGITMSWLYSCISVTEFPFILNWRSCSFGCVCVWNYWAWKQSALGAVSDGTEHIGTEFLSLVFLFSTCEMQWPVLLLTFGWYCLLIYQNAVALIIDSNDYW